MKRLIALLPLFLALFCFSCNSGTSSNTEAAESAAAEKFIKETTLIDSLTTELDQETKKLDNAMDELSQEFDQ